MNPSLPRAFQALSQENLLHLNRLLDAKPLRQVLTILTSPPPEGLGLKISYGTLYRYNQERWAHRLLEQAKIAAPQADQILASPHRFHQATIALLQQQAFQLALQPDLPLSKIQLLFKIIHRERHLDLLFQSLQLKQSSLRTSPPLPRPKTTPIPVSFSPPISFTAEFPVHPQPPTIQGNRSPGIHPSSRGQIPPLPFLPPRTAPPQPSSMIHFDQLCTRLSPSPHDPSTTPLHI